MLDKDTKNNSFNDDKIVKEVMEQANKTLKENGIDRDMFSKKPKKEKIYEDSYLFVNQSAMGEIVTTSTPLESSMFMYLICIAGYKNLVDLEVLQISEDLGISKSSTLRTIKSLIESKMIYKAKKGKRSYYIINPNISFKGKAEEKRKLLIKLDNTPKLELILDETNKLVLK
jgi:DNA-binding transcriptional ArsR family regulator